MDFKQYKETTKSNLPPALEAGQRIGKITRIEPNTFNLNGAETKGMHIHTDLGVFRTSSGVIMDILTKYFEKNSEPLENVVVSAPRGKRYLTLDGA